MTKETVLNKIKHGLIVSCQMEKHAPCYSDDAVLLLAKAAVWGGARALRIEGVKNVRRVKTEFRDIPIIGLVKIFRDDTPVFMTPSMSEVDELVSAGAEIIAVDGTDRLIDNHPADTIIPQVKKKYPDSLILADVRDENDAVKALTLGADLVAPTFYRFKKEAKSTEQADFKMFARMVKLCEGKGLCLMEGKIWTADEAIKALYYGAYAVVVGTAITRPHLITRHFVDQIEGFSGERSLYY